MDVMDNMDIMDVMDNMGVTPQVLILSILSIGLCLFKRMRASFY